jgi:hypothetical protein
MAGAGAAAASAGSVLRAANISHERMDLQSDEPNV